MSTKTYDVIEFCGKPRLWWKPIDVFGIVPHDAELPWEWVVVDGGCALDEESATALRRQLADESGQEKLDA